MHVEPPPQSTEQVPAHVMWQVAPPEQSTLALGPTSMLQVELPVHLRLHELPQVPEHSFMLAQFSVQLAPHVLSLIAHD